MSAANNSYMYFQRNTEMLCFAQHDSLAFPSNLLWKRLKLFSRFEADGLTRLDINLCPRARVSSNTGLAGLHVENAKSSQLYPFSLGQGLLHRLEDSLHGNFGLGLCNAGPVDNIIDEIKLYQ